MLALAGVVGVWAARRHPGPWLKPAACVLAGIVFAAWAGEYIADGILGIWSVKYDLPLQLTDAVSLATIAALLSLAGGAPRQRLVELVYFWGLSASLQAILTPDLAYDFPSVFYFTYFAYHVGAVLAALVLVFGLRMYPTPGAVGRVYAATLAWTALAGAGCLITGGNYMYLRSKPVHGSLLNVMGPWPWYIVSTAALGLAMLLALSAIARGAARVEERGRKLAAQVRA